MHVGLFTELGLCSVARPRRGRVAPRAATSPAWASLVTGVEFLGHDADLWLRQAGDAQCFDEVCREGDLRPGNGFGEVVERDPSTVIGVKFCSTQSLMCSASAGLFGPGSMSCFPESLMNLGMPIPVDSM